MKIFQALVAYLLLVSGLWAQGQTSDRFRFWKPIDHTAAKDDEIVAFTLDSDIYAATRDGLPDVRVLDEAQTQTSFLIEAQIEVRQKPSPRIFNTEIVKLRPDGNALEVRLRLPDKAPDAESFTFATPLTNYERKVRVSGSADGMKWTPLVTDGIIFDYSRYMDVSSREIALPKNRFREFKLMIEDVTDEKESPFKELTRTFKNAKEDQRVERTVIERRPFRIDRIDYRGMVAGPPARQPMTTMYPVAEFDAKVDAAKKQTIIMVRTRREPITRFALETSNRNFSRQVVVEVPVMSGASTDWRTIAETTIENFSFRKQKRERLTIAIPERRADQFRIIIRNEDNPPLSVTGVRAEGSVERVVFLAQPAKTYRVFYGSETAPAPNYEALAVLTKLRQDNTPVAAPLGAQVSTGEFAEKPGPTARGWFNNWIFLGAAIVLMVAVLGWCLFRAGRRLESLPKE